MIINVSKNRAWLRPDHFYGCDKGRPGGGGACLADGIPEDGVSVKMSWFALPGVRVKTFSAHVVVVFRLIVSEKRFSTHGRIRGNREI